MATTTTIATTLEEYLMMVLYYDYEVINKIRMFCPYKEKTMGTSIFALRLFRMPSGW